MSDATTWPEPLDAATPETEAKTPKDLAKTDYSVSAGFSARLSGLGLSLAFSSYQSGLLYMVGVKPDGGVNIHQMAFPRPMGLHRHGAHGLSLAADDQILHLQNVLDPQERVNTLFDAAFMPRQSEFTGQLDLHDLGVDESGNSIFVNTRYNCLATPDTRHSFREVWRPPFISALVDEDRCHLNGLAMQDGQPRYVTAVSRSDTIDGWRDRRADGGIVINVETGDIVCDGLSMPHSPRLHGGRLWLLNSGHGELGTVEFDEDSKGRFQPHVFCPGFARGLSLHGRYAFVGLSKPRYKRFEGLAEADSAPWCGVQIIDLETKTCVDWLRINGATSELYDLELLHGHLCPMAAAPGSPEAANLITTPKPA
ncbi:TIGR03032 family protein [Rhodobacteraceae bacterium B1Z28]|uniref:TIGR03032 family protein n=1 Tax=Ruegeria haliotis TaxID=2747601 RepID=A0ABX2PZ12_9RHOB|nr:TIGR03032 family protein [Ruegeria haliotis]NVO58307.1 TIGR03032 family protein [Ruegeria haliotis]